MPLWIAAVCGGVTRPEATIPFAVLGGTGVPEPDGTGAELLAAVVAGALGAAGVAECVVAASGDVAGAGDELEALVLGCGGVRSRVMRLPQPDSPSAHATASEIRTGRGEGTWPR